MKRCILESFLSLLLLLASAPVARGQLPRGPEFLVNAKTSGAQTHADVAMAADGSFVVVWVDGAFPEPTNVMARVFAADGRPRTGDLRVSASEPDLQHHPRVAVNAAGDFVVVWSYGFSEEDRPRVYGRLFRADGEPLGERFPLGRGMGRAQSEPDVARAPGGQFVVAWTEHDGRIDPHFQVPITDVFVRRFSARGAPKGTELRIGGRAFQYDPAVAINRAGDFVVAYTDETEDPDAEDLTDIIVCRFSRDGLPLSPARINAATPELPDDSEVWPAVALGDAGGIVLVWSGRHYSEPLFALWTRQYKPNGRRRGEAFRLTSSIAVPAYRHALGLAADGSFIVAWTGQEGDGLNDPDVFVRRLAPDGSPLSPEIPIAQWTDGQQRGAAMALAPDGRGIVVWESEGRDGDSYGISARRLRAGRP